MSAITKRVALVHSLIMVTISGTLLSLSRGGWGGDHVRRETVCTHSPNDNQNSNILNNLFTQGSRQWGFVKISVKILTVMTNCIVNNEIIIQLNVWIQMMRSKKKWREIKVFHRHLPNLPANQYMKTFLPPPPPS